MLLFKNYFLLVKSCFFFLSNLSSPAALPHHVALCVSTLFICMQCFT